MIYEVIIFLMLVFIKFLKPNRRFTLKMDYDFHDFIYCSY